MHDKFTLVYVIGIMIQFAWVRRPSFHNLLIKGLTRLLAIDATDFIF